MSFFYVQRSRKIRTAKARTGITEKCSVILRNEGREERWHGIGGLLGMTSIHDNLFEVIDMETMYYFYTDLTTTPSLCSSPTFHYTTLVFNVCLGPESIAP